MLTLWRTPSVVKCLKSFGVISYFRYVPVFHSNISFTVRDVKRHNEHRQGFKYSVQFSSSLTKKATSYLPLQFLSFLGKDKKNKIRKSKCLSRMTDAFNAVKLKYAALVRSRNRSTLTVTTGESHSSSFIFIESLILCKWWIQLHLHDGNQRPLMTINATIDELSSSFTAQQSPSSFLSSVLVLQGDEVLTVIKMKAQWPAWQPLNVWVSSATFLKTFG